MQNSLISTLKKNPNFKKIRGKLTSIQIGTNAEEIKSIYIWDSLRKNLPLVCIETNRKIFLGITLARQSSDFLAAIAKNILISLNKSEELLFQKNSLSLIQYMFPKDYTSLKLICFLEWENVDDYLKVQEQLSGIQNEFLKKVQNIVINN